MRIKLAAIAKNEAPYFAQWIFHHSMVGFTDFEIWVNNSQDQSLEVLSRLANNLNLNITFKEASQEYLNAQGQFQFAAYKKIAEESKFSCEYLMFLDLDEFVVTPNLESISDVLASFHSPDAIAFPWVIDCPDDGLELFSLPIDFRFGYLNRHVKTIFKPQKGSPGIHSIDTSSIRYLNHLGHFFHPDAEYGRSLLPQSQMHLERNSTFILHAVNRTEIEYLARLSRGRVDPRFGPIKENRNGYLSFGDCRELSFPQTVISTYKVKFSRFCSEANLSEFDDALESDVLSQSRVAIEMLLEHGLPNYYRQIRGLKSLRSKMPLDVQSEIKAVIDTADLLEGDLIRIEGWAYDWLFGSDLRFTYGLGSSPEHEPIEHEIKSRTDVLATHPDAPLECGFAFTFPKSPRFTAADDFHLGIWSGGKLVHQLTKSLRVSNTG